MKSYRWPRHLVHGRTASSDNGQDEPNDPLDCGMQSGPCIYVDADACPFKGCFAKVAER